MVHGRQSGLGRRAPSTRRKTVWTEGPFSNAAIQAISASGLVVVTVGQTSAGGVTLVRIRGELVMWLEVVGAIGDGFAEVDAGIGIVSADAFGIGATAMPSPSVDKDWGGWIWHNSLGPIIGLSVTEVENTGQISQVRIPIDTKAMRKLIGNTTVFGAVAARGLIGAATISFGMSTRMLSMLP